MSYQNTSSILSRFLSSYESSSDGNITTLALAVADRWSALKKYLYQCWLHVYGPLFWITTAFFCMKPSQDYDKLKALEALSFSDDPNDYYPLWYNNPSDSETSDESVSPSTPIKDDPESTPGIAALKAPSLFKRTIKDHFQSIKQKQHSLNEVMKRPFRKHSHPAKSGSNSPPASPTPSISSSSSSSSSGTTTPCRQRRLFPQSEVRRSSVSDALLKSLSLRSKPQRSAETWTLSPHSNNNKSYFDSPFVTEPESWEGVTGGHSLTDKLAIPLPPITPLRRKTAPDIMKCKVAHRQES
ncbi:hypothetical protein DFQ28_008449 [Apophysomyces sp. BC1034]|nr:hypothetical protein DFQ30_008292 [Apophysomyces sp. BC1015]KAG0174109.1 hypothetical protein DFQ29_007599 [Apophysomyces sp. BC1021]KAG0186008.1 hypothetical protein DFQ28_008449 [Apophysomyces sp. BC1034]